MKRSQRIEFRVTEEERVAYDKARGIVPLGAWIRYVLNVFGVPWEDRQPRERSGNGS